MSEALCVEMMTRQLGDEQQNMTRKVVLNQILVCLAPWMQNIILNARWESEHFSVLNSHDSAHILPPPFLFPSEHQQTDVHRLLVLV